MTEDIRLNSLNHWLKTLYPLEKIHLTPIQGDASFRRYFRATIDTVSYILMDSPPKTEPLLPFIYSTNYLKDAHVNVPNIHHQNSDQGFLMLDDFGNNDFFKTLDHKNADHYYKKAIDELIKIQKSPNNQALPLFDEAHIKKELSLFTDWYLKKHLGMSSVSLENTFDLLAKNCLKQPYTTIHRDYHCRNLMLLHDDSVGIIDHQDLMYGPISYDLVSLLKDCYIDWPDDQVKTWVNYYLQMRPTACENFFELFELTGLQRHLKAIGIFARLSHRDNNHNFLQYIPRTLSYVKKMVEEKPYLKELAALISRL